MTCRIGLRHHAPERLAKHDRLLNPQRFAERMNVVTPLSQCPGRGVARNAASIPAVVEVDDLGNVGEHIEVAAQPGMIETWPTMQNDQCRLLAHPRTVGLKRRAHDVKEDRLIA